MTLLRIWTGLESASDAPVRSIGASAYVIFVGWFLLNIPELYVLIRTTCDKATSIWANVHRPQRSRVAFYRIHQ